MGVWIGVAVAVAVAALAVASYLVISLRNLQATVDDSWQQVLLSMRRRRDLVLELADAVRAGSGGDVDFVARVGDASAVAALPGASPEQQVLAEVDLDDVLSELSVAVSESSVLLADPEVTKLRGLLDDADRRVAARRSDYERSAHTLRRRASSAPSSWVARFLDIGADDRPADQSGEPE